MKEQILKLKSEGNSYEQIAALIPCAVSTVWYYCTDGAKENRIARSKIAKEKFRIEIKMMFGGKCSICPYDKCLDALEFHHKEAEEKEYEIGRLLADGCRKKALKEVKKCVLVCANCHREIHAKERQDKLAPTLGNAPS